MAVINTNYLSLVAQNNLSKSQSSLGTAIERLSSGLRINSAKDDAAGQAIANRFTANVNGLTQAARNANDGISIAQTTEGALSEVNNNLQRIRELAVQAANGTNSSSDLKSIQDEISQRLEEIDRVSSQTQFNGVKVLAQDNSLSIQVGANDNQTININLQQIDSSTLGLSGFSVAQKTLNVGAAVTSFGGSSTAAPATIDVSAAATKLGVDASTLTVHNVLTSAGAATSQYVVQSGDDFYAASISTTGAVTLNTTDVAYTDTDNGVTTAATLSSQLVHVGVDSAGAATAYVAVSGTNYTTAATALSNAGASTNVAASATIALSGATPTAAFTSASTVDPLAKIDAALAKVDGFRSQLGAIQNRFDSAITNLNNTINNLSAARSGIQDADYATEVSNMTRAQILQQAGTSVLAQANQVPQTVLSLLR
ncbi:flagellin [Bordetella genomosp. 10]|uniref:Flagellin n=1 Tax=Bordetella genomosp. 10 TaxID=1416804 RepID=A0A261RXD3_9BORD|nr:FliC/FljB family flagellin [Bordetella genomosp. 10]OZI29738.1 flagellin [Bordetella genomosp. 10]